MPKAKPKAKCASWLEHPGVRPPRSKSGKYTVSIQVTEAELWQLVDKHVRSPKRTSGLSLTEWMRARLLGICGPRQVDFSGDTTVRRPSK